MTDREEREEHIKRLEAALACEEKQFSGKCSKAECDDNCALLYEQGNWGEWKETLRYTIDSLKTDLKYDLLYEETSGQADKQADKPTTKNDCETCIHNKGVLECDMYGCKYEPTAKNDLVVDAISRQALIDWLTNWTLGDATPLIDFVNSMPPVTPQLSSGLEKNSKKLEKDFGESDCISRQATVKRLCKLAEFMNEHKEESGAPYIMAALFIQDNKTEFPSVTPQEPRKGHWIEHPRTKELRFHHIYECSACKTQIIGNRYNVGNYKYCPHCGIEFEVEE